MQDHKSKAPRRATSSRKGEKNITSVPSHFIQTDVSHIKSETSIFSNMVFYFVNVPSSHSLDSLHKMVAEHGGTFSMNLNNSVTRCIAAESKGIKFQAAKLHGDVIHCSWLFDCHSQKKLLPLQPKYFHFLSDSTKRKLLEEIDEFSDSYYMDIDLTDIRQILCNVDHLVDLKTVSYYKKKYCPKEKWIMFHDCCIYFYLPTRYMNSSDWKILFEIASTRLRIEVSFGGGRVVDNLSHATHFVVMSVPDHNVDFNELLSSFSAAEQRLLRNKRLHVVSSQWLEKSLNNEQKLPEESYTLRPNGQEDSIEWESEHDESLGDSSSLALQKEKSVTDNAAYSRKTKVNLDKSSVVTVSPRSGQTKRGRPIGQTTRKGKSIVKQQRRTRARVGSKPVKICEDEPVESVLEKEQTVEELSGSDSENCDSHKILNDHISKSTVNEHAENSGILGDKELVRDAECNMETDGLLEAHERSYGNERTGKELLTSEQMEDPVQAMLFGLIPSLGTQKEKAESSKPVPVDENLTDEPKPVKKKKVSYKEMADELLKDW
ncbi:hypothetical protein Leryth_012224 [Lithospermum erythrorhizon]|nr:hypothetical protein Leryth_012224 [Lithospermum erythrorhizon]